MCSSHQKTPKHDFPNVTSPKDHGNSRSDETWTVEEAEVAARDRRIWLHFLRQAAGADGEHDAAIW